ncbi:hypothetical protein FACS189499_06170 [Clostridia bacterium]|nr:hypothetical protein FACS189499_06170 [Clostridia bacterium]
MSNLQNEISREPPIDCQKLTFSSGKPIFYAFECALLEQESENFFAYTAVNLNSGESKVISKRKSPLSTNEIDKMAEKILKSGIAGVGGLQADRLPHRICAVKRQISFDKAREITKAVFAEIMPKNGFTTRKEQISLAEHILNTIKKRGVTLAEAETGIGKTYAYLVPAIIAKRGRINDFWNTDIYPQIPYAEMSKMPIVIATSSIALQKAIITEYIPLLSKNSA